MRIESPNQRFQKRALRPVQGKSAGMPGSAQLDGHFQEGVCAHRRRRCLEVMEVRGPEIALVVVGQATVHQGASIVVIVAQPLEEAASPVHQWTNRSDRSPIVESSRRHEGRDQVTRRLRCVSSIGLGIAAAKRPQARCPPRSACWRQATNARPQCRTVTLIPTSV